MEGKITRSIWVEWDFKRQLEIKSLRLGERSGLRNTVLDIIDIEVIEKKLREWLRWPWLPPPS